MRAARGTLPVQTTLVLAGRERIIRNTPTLAWLTKLAARPPAIHTFADAAHTLEFEADVGEFGRRLAQWASA